MTSINDTLQYLLGVILPDQNISIETVQEDDLARLIIVAPPEMVGQIIGKDGRIIKAIRLLLSLSHPNQRFSLEIKD